MLKIQKVIFLTALIYSLILMLLSGCQSGTNINKTNVHSLDILNATVTVNFAPDGRLWRLIPTKHAVYVDFSNDKGKTYSTPVKVNSTEQKISAWPENPPAIKISHSGRINVLYYADEAQKSTSFYSYSDDNGQTFNRPTLISDHAQSAMHYMDKMLVAKDNTLYLFWHDTRHESHDKERDTGTLSLYYSEKKQSDSSQFSNKFISGGICSCCRTATAFSANGKPVILARMVYANGVRDHALIYMDNNGSWKKSQQVTHDNWEIEACPEHGPSIAIDDKDRTHLTWFTLGDTRQGIFYGYTDDYGKTISAPLALGNINQAPSHPDVIALKKRVIIAWKEFDGEQTTIHIKESLDRGESWIDKATGLKSQSKNSHPKLITNNTDIFLSWTSKNEGHQLIKI